MRAFAATLVLAGVAMLAGFGALAVALGFVASAAGFWLLAENRHRAACAVGVAAYLLGAGTLVAYLVIAALKVPVALPLTAGAWAMSPAAAAGFTWLGGALALAANRPPRLGGAALFASVLLIMAGVQLLTAGTGVRWTLEWWPHESAIPNTILPPIASAGMLLGSVGVVGWVVAEIRATGQATARLLPLFIVATAAVVILGGVMLAGNEHRRQAARDISQALEVETVVARFTGDVARLEAATQTFVLSGAEPDFERLRAERAAAIAALARLKEATAAQPRWHALSSALAPALQEEFRRADREIGARRQRGLADAATELRAGRPALAATVRAITDELQTAAAAAVEEEQQYFNRVESVMRVILVTGLVITIVLLAIAFRLVARAQHRLQEVNDALEVRVRERTAALQASTAQLQASAQRLRFMADTMPQLVWTVRPDGQIETLNRGWISYLGVTSEAEGLRIVTDSVHPDDRATTDAEWSAMLSAGRAAAGELRLRRADGAYRWHLWRAHPERDANGRVVRWIGTSTDIHDRKALESGLEQRVVERTAELATSEERFRQAFYFAGIGMAIVGLDGRFLRVNRSLCETVGYSEAELLDKTFQEITHPDDLGADLDHVRELLADERRYYQMEKRYLHREGHVVWIRLTASLVRDPGGAPAHLVSQIEDITARKELEASLARARDQALEASRLKSEFLATMSHEIRTPMNGVIGMTSLLRDTPLSETQSEYVRTIESSGETLLAIINDILDYSKIEAGRIDLEVVTFDLRQCVEDALDLFAASAFEKKIELVYVMGPMVPTQVAGDVTRLRQILVNLLSNAIKFTMAGEVVITIDAEATGGRYRLRFAVKDTGIGIPPEGMNRLFQSFSQVDASTTRRFGGTGLGLVISRRLAELMGGEMWAESVAGEGSTFHFTVVVDARPQLVQHNLYARQPELEGHRLLVVDDNATNRRVVAGLATAWGMSVVEADSPRAALAVVAAGPRCDIGVLDMHMPDMDGDQLAAAIHALPEQGSLPLVLLTSLGRRPHSAHIRQSLAKPVRADPLYNALCGCLRPGVSARPKEPASPAYDATLGRRLPLRLLVAEDNPVNQKVVNLLLQRLGYGTTTVTNGREAIAAVETGDYDAILMDVEMPEVDGCEATRRIRALRGNVTRPWIIALTASAMQGDRERAFAAGMNDFLTKPLRTEALIESLVRAHATLASRPAAATN